MCEHRHLQIMEGSGIEEALRFSLQTLRIYRKAVLNTGKHGRAFSHASLPTYKRSFIESYLEFKQFWFQNNPQIVNS